MSNNPISDTVLANIQSDIDKDNVFMLTFYHDNGIDLNNVLIDDLPLLHYTILLNKTHCFDALMGFGLNLENRDPEDGSSALNFAASYGKSYYVSELIAFGADLNSQDNYGFTPLNAACYLQNFKAAKILLSEQGVDVNQPELAEGTPPIYWLLHEHDQGMLIHKLKEHPTYDPVYNAMLLESNYFPFYFFNTTDNILTHDMAFFYNLKYFAHKFDIAGTFSLQSYSHMNWNTFEFEGLHNEVSYFEVFLSFEQFYNDFSYNANLNTVDSIVFNNVFDAANLTNEGGFNFIKNDLAADVLSSIESGGIAIIPSGWNAHSIYFVIDGDLLFKCNRGNKSDGEHGIEVFSISHHENLSYDLVDYMLEARGKPKYLHHDLIDILGLEILHQVENPTQIAGNCAWTSAETAIEAAFIASYIDQGYSIDEAAYFAKGIFHIWEEYDLSLTLSHTVENKGLYIEEGIYGDLLISVIMVHHDVNNPGDIYRGAAILTQLDEPSVMEAFTNHIVPSVIQHDPVNCFDISYIKPFEPASYEYTEIIDTSSISHHDQVNNQAYFDFLKACDDYQNDFTTPIDFSDVLNIPTPDTLSTFLNEAHAHIDMPATPADTIVIDTFVNPLPQQVDQVLTNQIIA